MSANPNPLTKFLLASAISFFIGTLHGMLQVMPPIRHWLDSIGSPTVGPGHMIDPLAHAHMNLVGGVVLLTMGVTYYLLPIFTGKPIHSRRLIDLTFWCTLSGAYGFYVVEMTFGIWEGMLIHTPELLGGVDRYRGPLVAVWSTIMATGFCCYLANVALTLGARKPTP